MKFKDYSLSNETRQKIVYNVLDFIQETHYNEVMKNVSFLQEKNKFYNWYMGYTYTFNSVPRFDKEKKLMTHAIQTSASSGEISTKGFGERLQMEDIEGNLLAFISLRTPPSVKNNDSVKLTMIFKKNSIEHISFGSYEKFLYENYEIFSDVNEFVSTESSSLWNSFKNERRIAGDVSFIDQDFNPGFELQWFYNISSVASERRYGEKFHNEQFKKLVNLLFALKDKNKLWSKVKEIRQEYIFDPNTKCSTKRNQYMVTNVNVHDEYQIIFFLVFVRGKYQQ